MKKDVQAVAVRAGLTMGAILAAAELAFGIALYFLRPVMNEYINAGQQELSTLTPLITTWAALLFLVVAIYFACGMIVARRLAPLPIQSHEIATYGAVAGAIAELLRSLVAVVVNLAISYLSPLAGVQTADVLSTALANAGIRLLCSLPIFVLAAMVVAGVSAYLFSIIFFRSDSTT